MSDINFAHKEGIMGFDGDDWVPVSVNSNGVVDVNASVTIGDVELEAGVPDGTAFTADVTSTLPVAGVYESSPSAVTDGDLAVVGLTAARRLKTSATVDAALPAGTNAIGKLAANSGVDIGDVDVTSIAAGDNNIGNVDIVTMPNVTLAAGTNTNEVVGDAAHDAAVAGNPVRLGAYAKTTAPTDVSADGDTVNLWADLAGRLQVGDGGTTLSVDDGSSSLTVDGTVAVSSITTAIVPGTAATNLGKAEDAAHSSGDTGVMALVVRQDSQVDFGADGDYVPMSVDADGGLRVSIIAGAGSGGTAAADDADFTAGTTLGTPVQGVYESTPTSVTDGDLGTVGITIGRRLKTSSTLDAAIPAGNNNIGDVDIASIAAGNNNIGDVDVASIVPGVAATNLGKAEDDAHTSGDVGVMALGVRTDAPANKAANGDYEPFQVSGGRVWVSAVIDTALPAGSAAIGKLAANSGVIIGDVNVVSNIPGVAATSLGKAEDAVHASGDTGVMLLAVRSDTAAAKATTDGDYIPLITDSTGKLHVNVGNTVTVGSHAVTNAGTFAVQVDGAALTALQLIDNPVVVDDAAFTPGTTSVSMAGFEADETSTDSVNEGDAGAARMTLDRKQIVTIQPHAAGGTTIFRSLDLDETEEQAKATAGCVYGAWVTNTTDATLWLKFYNATAANVTVGSTTPLITIGVPGNTSDDISANFNVGGQGITFDTAITVAATTGFADADTGAPSANAMIINVFYA